MKRYSQLLVLPLAFAVFFGSGCRKNELLRNPNVAETGSTIPPSLILNHITATLMREEEPVMSPACRYNQFLVSNYSYYFGLNSYNWTNTAHTYDIVRYCNKMEEQARKQSGTEDNVYKALGSFFKAYAYIWMTQRLGDIPMTQAGNPDIANPAYDDQETVYKNCLALLESANTLMAKVTTAANINAPVDPSGDIFGLTYSKWRRVINSYRLRVLISLSKRADDTPELDIKKQFARIVADPDNYPVISGNADNLAYRYTAITLYPPNKIGYTQYNSCANISQTWLQQTASHNDPRVFVVAVPAPAQLASGKNVNDFSAYAGEDNARSQGLMSAFSADGKCSSLSYNRYMSSASGANAEPYILIGYAEHCFNMAEAAQRGWVSGEDAEKWYRKGILASMEVFGLTQGKTLTIGNADGTKPSIGTAVADINGFLSRPGITYNATTGLQQILTQKYVAFFMNSGYEAYFNWRRTGIPTFSENGAGIGTPDNRIPLRWKYPQDEINYNAANYQMAIAAQYQGKDDMTARMWLIR